MTIQRMDHVGIVVDDLPAAIEFFVQLGLELEGQGSVAGSWADRVLGIDGMTADIAMLKTPDGQSRVELSKVHTPTDRGDAGDSTPITPGIRHICFAVDDVDAIVAGLRARGTELVGQVETYEGSYRLCYVRGPEGIIVELAQQLG